MNVFLLFTDLNNSFFLKQRSKQKQRKKMKKAKMHLPNPSQQARFLSRVKLI